MKSNPRSCSKYLQTGTISKIQPGKAKEREVSRVAPLLVRLWCAGALKSTLTQRRTRSRDSATGRLISTFPWPQISRRFRDICTRNTRILAGPILWEPFLTLDVAKTGIWNQLKWIEVLKKADQNRGDFPSACRPPEATFLPASLLHHLRSSRVISWKLWAARGWLVEVMCFRDTVWPAHPWKQDPSRQGVNRYESRRSRWSPWSWALW